MNNEIMCIDVENNQGQTIRHYDSVNEFVADSNKRVDNGEDLTDIYPYAVHPDHSSSSITFMGELI